MKEITPNWWEYHRVKAIYLRADNRRIHEIQTAYKDAIEYNEYDELHDVSKYSFAQYLIEEYKENTNYYEALKHIEEAIRSPHANVYDFLVLKARCLLLMQNRLGEAIELYRQIWEEHLPQKSDLDVRIVGTQYADALRRRVGQSIGLGDYGEAWETAIQAGTILDAIIEKSRWDTRTARLGTQLLAQMLRLSGNKESKEMVLSLASKWDSSRRFVRMCGSDRRTRAQFERLGGLSDILPRASANALSGTQTFTGTVSRIADKYGFIKSDKFEQDLFFNRNSLANPNDWQYLLEGFEVTFGVKDDPDGRNMQSDPPKIPPVQRIQWNGPKSHVYSGSVSRLSNEVDSEYGFISSICPSIPGDSVYMDPSSLANPNDWQKLTVDGRVSFLAVHARSGPRAIRLKTE